MSAPPFRQVSTIYESVMDAVQSKIPEITFSLGARERYHNNTVPRFCWVPTDDAFREPQAAPSYGGTDPRTIWTREASFEIDIWGADIDATEELARVLIETLEECTGGSYNLRGGKWDTSGETAELGILYTLLLDLDVPVTIASPSTTTVQISDLPMTKVIETP